MQVCHEVMYQYGVDCHCIMALDCGSNGHFVVAEFLALHWCCTFISSKIIGAFVVGLSY